MRLSGTPVDCVSLALSGALFSWTKPLLVCFILSYLKEVNSVIFNVVCFFKDVILFLSLVGRVGNKWYQQGFELWTPHVSCCICSSLT